MEFTFGQHGTSTLQTSEEKYYNYGTNSYCDYVILPNLVEVPMLETDNIQQKGTECNTSVKKAVRNGQNSVCMGVFKDVSVRGRSASSDVSSDISPSPLYIPPHRR